MNLTSFTENADFGQSYAFKAHSWRSSVPKRSISSGPWSPIAVSHKSPIEPMKKY